MCRPAFQTYRAKSEQKMSKGSFARKQYGLHPRVSLSARGCTPVGFPARALFPACRQPWQCIAAHPRVSLHGHCFATCAGICTKDVFLPVISCFFAEFVYNLLFMS
jgi:hypothetical protein